ncbi:MAG: hypothetical protein A3J65_01390 [Candidatus Buchananbacteria bacterium RIFCSPHIGHO2_02_FULL_45_11b]|uniref:PSP1 C-terminal domain-containing protein n=4 Tax=Candidatus Buchananiibacteriota TaxID=1817903 RepID=A0A1G1Y9E0_9BACT|nr:MAG: hypothetical protein A2663_01830 [Candidatus Buchananbacteria bacterium RIFCSPHIGHO2_01_FULL_46_12]OGY51010.1 MAG: hypothetical protein A3J65_01390 [Candidatus Buchananbacteria bacterium RIFCSPHIGHO2_02_FULL_45_11b]OGY52923.1 MAG: hypothetical protein A3B15_02255 [Candidatus Buchananbacteria bacterium RIFCSPLOWO2_01_FULL_45_31]OGY56861.1 MAG: hypothetical protein A3H67_01950 [Candidatus Buchananbacteria bacterium RIFCSPLOWO2_02_FULL_46_11b]
MPKLAQIQVAFWDQTYRGLAGDLPLALGDFVVIKTEWGTEIGKISSWQEIGEDKASELKDSLAPILRQATTEDSEILAEAEKQRPAALEYCKKSVERLGLPMKVIDAHFSFDGSRLIFPFISDGRVDFRVLVKDLTHHFQKLIRLQQIGIRDEAKISGDLGSCGRQLCCRTHLKELSSITSEFADLQQISQRGSERLSGLCGRLRCCLAFEQRMYEDLAKNLPPVGAQVKTAQGKGKITSRNILKQTVNVALEGEGNNIVEVPAKAVRS